jgi:hypothetical protein
MLERRDLPGCEDLADAAGGERQSQQSVKTAQTLLGHSDSRLTLDHYAQAVTELGAAAAEAMGKRFLNIAPRDGSAMDRGSGGNAGQLHPSPAPFRRAGPLIARPRRGPSRPGASGAARGR